jgi:hypothetical protein
MVARATEAKMVSAIYTRQTASDLRCERRCSGERIDHDLLRCYVRYA